jgi:hypothetical protein
MKILCASGIHNIFYIHNYKNDELVPYFSEIADVSITKV